MGRIAPLGRISSLAFCVLIGLFGIPQTFGHWSFDPISAPPVPSVPAAFGPVRTSVDPFIYAKLAEHHLNPAPEAERRFLIRRLSFDLRGLPPTREEIAQFLNDHRQDAYEQLVERFLASPQYGERWGRHWLDIAAYADSNGYFSADSDRPLAWKYRDYVIRSINEDKPFDRFIREQLAGDELAGYHPDADITPEMVDLLVATHFWRNVPDGTDGSDGNPLELKVDRYSVIEGNVQLIGSAFLGLTLQCARCHDHKFEPVTHDDYYALQAILRPAFDPEHWLKPNERTLTIGSRAERDKNKKDLREHEQALKTLKESLAGLTAPFQKQFLEEKLDALNDPDRKDLRAALEAKPKDRTDTMKALLEKHADLIKTNEVTLAARFPEFAAASLPLKSELKRREGNAPTALPAISVLVEPAGPPPVHHLLLRGNHAREGKEEPPGVPVSLIRSNGFSPVAAGPSTGRRLALAHWLTSPENPLVARVFVNRVWQRHFGMGLVATPDNFGKSGAAPTHQDLLNWLAADFIQSGWSLKHLHRLIVNSATYRQSPASQDQSLASNGGGSNSPALYYAGFPILRLDAESMRDAMLCASGEIKLAIGGPGIPIKTDAAGQFIIDEQGPGAARRSVYLQQHRTQPVNLIDTFDGPAHNPVCIQRIQSTVVLQSLSQLNSDVVRARARAFAKRILNAPDSCLESPDSNKRQRAMDLAFELAWNRPATAVEIAAAAKFLASQIEVYVHESGAEEKVWTDFCQMLLASNQFLYVE